MNTELYNLGQQQRSKRDGESSVPIADLAAEAFGKRERVKALETMNTPVDYEERKKAFIELETARHEAIQAENALRSAQQR